MSSSIEAKGVPFSFFSSLIREISKIRPSQSKTRPPKRTSTTTTIDYPAFQIFHRWVNELQKRFAPLPPHTTSTCFRLLFPEEDTHRKYDIQETRMIHLLADCFGIDNKSFERWSLEEATGCLGQELNVALTRSCSYDEGYISPLTISEVDTLLDELASKSGFTETSIRSKQTQRRPRKTIIRALFRQLSPEDASVLVQIILKDLRPLLYPLTEFHYTTALTRFDVASVKTLSKEHAMDIWDPSGMFLRYYRVCADISEAATFADSPTKKSKYINPTIGKPVAIPKSEKGRGSEHALHFLADSERVWAETKYDGERAQIHVQVNGDGSSFITIFSKSRRDSTMDRHAVHDIIRAALRLTGTDQTECKVKQNIILDAEMVAFRGEAIDEFWRIRQLIEDTAYGVRSGKRPIEAVEEPESMNSLANEDLSLGLVFFDVLYLDSKSLLSTSYAERRETLETLIDSTSGKAILAARYPINMLATDPCKELYTIFAEHIAACQEGLVLKAEESMYNDYRKPWVKIKRDYLPEAGDQLDLVIVGAAWEKIRARSLRVPPTTYTTFIVGAVESAKEHPSTIPRVFAYFTVSYGLKRDDLERINFFIKSSDPIPFSSIEKHHLPFQVEVFDGLRPTPTVILRQPLLVSLYGAGFTKSPRCKHYELRFPRITKYYLPSERKWQESLSLEEVHRIALESVGRDRSDKDISDWANITWGKIASPRANCPVKRKTKAEHWEKRLAQLDGKPVIGLPEMVRNRRKRSENDSPDETRQRKNRRKTIDSVLAPLSSRTNVDQSSSRLTPPQTPPTRSPAKPPWESIPDDVLVWFAQPARKRNVPLCSSVAAWKRRVPRELRLHSLDSLLLGSASSRVGVIVVDECDEHAEKWTRVIREKVVNQPIIVYGCRTGIVFSIVYRANGDPSNVLSLLTHPCVVPQALKPNTINIKFLLSPINPADINVIEGVYPTKPTKTELVPSSDPVFVAGNEGLARVTAVGKAVRSIKVNDWVLMAKQQSGTWASAVKNVADTDVVKVPDAEALTEAQASTLTINPPTAYNMLKGFIDLRPGDWVIQNGANSAVGQAVIQIAAARGSKTINLIRDRPELDSLKQKLYDKGATHVLTYDDIAAKAIREKVKDWTGGESIRLGLNCVGGEETTLMVRLLGTDAHLVSYGAMAKQPLSIPISNFIFKNLTCHGYWLSQWYKTSSRKERDTVMQYLVHLIKKQKLDTPEHEIVTITTKESDEEATEKIREIMRMLADGRYGKKVLLKIESNY